MRYSREIKIGIVTVLGIVVFFWGSRYLQGLGLTTGEKKFYLKYPTGKDLSPGKPVTLNGVKVGSISDIKINKSDFKSVIIAITVDQDIPVRSSGVVTVEISLVPGADLLTLDLGKKGSLAKNGDTLEARSQRGLSDIYDQEIKPIQSKVEGLITNIDTLVTTMNRILDTQTQSHITSIIERLSDMIEKTNRIINTNEKRVNEISENLAVSSKKFNKIVSQLDSIDLEQSLLRFDRVMANADTITDKIKRGDGTLGKLWKEEKIYDELKASTKELKELLYDVKENPWRYVHISIWGDDNEPYERPPDSVFEDEK